MTLTYNCETEQIKICDIEITNDVFQLGYTSKCCGNITTTGYTLSDAEDLLKGNVVVRYLTGHVYSGEPSCYDYWTYEFKIGADMTQVASVTGTVKYYDNLNNLINTDNVDLAYLGVFHTTTVIAGGKAVINLVYTLNDGTTVNFTSTITITIDCLTATYTVNTTSNYAHTYTLDGDGCAVINQALSDGYYNFEIDGTELCLIVECEPLECKVKNFITSLINLRCYECNQNENIELAMQLWMEYNMLLGTCADCCTKCLLYNKIINTIENCTNC